MYIHILCMYINVGKASIILRVYPFNVLFEERSIQQKSFSPMYELNYFENMLGGICLSASQIPEQGFASPKA